MKVVKHEKRKTHHIALAFHRYRTAFYLRDPFAHSDSFFSIPRKEELQKTQIEFLQLLFIV